MTFVLVAPLEKGVRLDQLHQLPACVVSRAMTSTNGFTMALVAFPRVGFQLDLHAFMQPDAVLQLHLLDRLRRHAGRIEVLARDDRRLFHKAVRHGFAERIVKNDVLERHAAPVPFPRTASPSVPSPMTGFNSLMARTPADAR